MRKLVFIHTVPDVISRLNREMKAKLGDVRIENIMDDQLSALLTSDRAAVLRRLNSHVKMARLSHKPEDVEFVLTCTALSDIVDETCADLKILDSYLHKALAGYTNILLVATSGGALGPTKAGIKKYSTAKQIRITELLVDGAREAMVNGFKPVHDEMIITAAIEELGQHSYDALVLCQPSMSHIKSRLTGQVSCEVLTGLDSFIANFSFA